MSSLGLLLPRCGFTDVARCEYSVMTIKMGSQKAGWVVIQVGYTVTIHINQYVHIKKYCC
jgi:hypothetical protein